MVGLCIAQARRQGEIVAGIDDDRGAPGDSSSDTFETAVRTHLPRMLTTAARILRDPVEASDAVQDACLQAHRNLDQFEGRSGIGTWLHRITVNAALARLRKRQRLRERGIDEHLPEHDQHGVLLGDPNWREVTPESLLIRAETRQIVREAIDQLPETYRIVLILRDIEELGTAETAEALDCTDGTIKTRLHRARLALKKLLHPILQEDQP
jgi:RNA polymerase sigma-70 factor (ECF subfamily)